MPLFPTKAEEAAYEVGYQDGESSGHADWLMMISDEFDLEGEEIEGPQGFIAALRKLYEITKKE